MNEAKFIGDPERIVVKNKEPDLVSPPKDGEKSNWMAGVFKCLSSVVSICKNEQYKGPQGNLEIPIEKITDLFYLGSGAQGVVFSAQLDGAMVAVKQLRTKQETNIKHLLKLNHPNIVRFYGTCTTTPNYYVIMEFCQYGPLHNYLSSNKLFIPNQLLKWAKQIAVGMEYLHSHKIIHRDLKSPNILICDELVVKVSDFGTSREWNDVSEVMSFSGTVAWMAPEVIRHEPCSERVDVWSFGVVLWELFSSEVPYRNMETHAIMWGVGTNSISLPIPSNFPSSLQQLIKQCWIQVPRNRPPFKIIAAQLDIAGGELRTMNIEEFRNIQEGWRDEINTSMGHLYSRSHKTFSQSTSDVVAQRREDLRQARNLRKGYEQQLSRANELFLEVCAMRLQLELREKNLIEKENALNECRCGHRGLKQQSLSLSSESLKLPECNEPRRKKKTELIAHAIVHYDEKRSKTKTTLQMDNAILPYVDQIELEESENNNIPKDTVVGLEDNADIANDFLNDNYVPDAARI